MCFYSGAHRNCTTLALEGSFGWTPSLVRSNLDALRLYNQIMWMDEQQLTCRAFASDCLHGGQRSRNVKNICASVGQADKFASKQLMNV